MDIGVVGSRNFNDYELLKSVLDDFKSKNNVVRVVSGGAKGADTLGHKWAVENKLYVDTYSPNWRKFGKGAGYIRNITIIDNSNVIIAFWDGKSKGTKHTIDNTKKKGKKCIIIYTDITIQRKIKIDRIKAQIEKKRFRLNL